MISLDPRAVRLGARAADKTDAIRQVGQILVDAGFIEPGYVDSLLAREKVANTFLGNGIAIPHGVPKDRGLIKKTGVAVLQVPAGVEWNPGDRVHLVVGIAAKSDEHLQILTNLTDVLGDAAEAARLAQTTEPGRHRAAPVRRAHRRRRGAAAEPLPEDLPNHFDVVIAGAHGLHARPATALVDVAKGFAATIRIRHGNRAGDAKSLIALLNLGVESGATIRVMAEGPDADAALAALREAIEAGLEEEEETAASAVATEADRHRLGGPQPWPVWRPRRGWPWGPCGSYQRGKIVVAATARDPAAELTRLERAIESAKRELAELYQEVKAKAGAGRAAIFLAHAEFLEDQGLIETPRAPDPRRRPQRRLRLGAAASWSRPRRWPPRRTPCSPPAPLDLRDVGGGCCASWPSASRTPRRRRPPRSS